MTPKTTKSERALIDRLSALLVHDGSAVPFGDDMAALPGAPGQLLWSTDMIMAGVHFRAGDQPWELVGRKALAINLSDCAAMGAVPVAALIAIALQNDLTMADAVAIHRGAEELGGAYECRLVGGDTNSWDRPTVISITIAAALPEERPPVLRSGLRPQDRIFVTGALGGSILGRHLRFTPRVREALEICSRLTPTAMIDISDGLALDLDRLRVASGCGIVLESRLLETVIHSDARQLADQDGRPALEHALHDGEDFELIVGIPPDVSENLLAGLPLREIGRATDDIDGVQIRGADGTLTPLAPIGWEHFR